MGIIQKSIIIQGGRKQNNSERIEQTVARGDQLRDEWWAFERNPEGIQ